MWYLANIIVYMDSLLAIEYTVNLEIDMPEADKKYTDTHTHTYIYIIYNIYRVIRNDCRGFNNLSYTIHLR